MVKKFIISALHRYPKSKKFKGVQKLKPQKVQVRRELLTDKQIRERQKIISDQNIRDTIGTQEFGKFSARSIEEMRGESIGITLANRKFFRSLKSNIKASRKRTSDFIKGASSNVKGSIRPKKVIPKFKVPTTQYYKSDILSKPVRTIKGKKYPASDPIFRYPKQGGQTIIGKSKIVTSKPLRIAKKRGTWKSYKEAQKTSNQLYTRTLNRFVGKEKRSPFKTITKSSKSYDTSFGGERAWKVQKDLAAGKTPSGYYSPIPKNKFRKK